MVIWMLEHEVFADGDQQLATAATDAGASVIAWNDDWWDSGRWPERPSEAIVFHGSLANAARIAEELPWTPGAFCATAGFCCSSWWPQVADLLVTSTFVETTVAALVEHGPPEDFGHRVFVRPDSPLKPFSGRVLQRDQVTLAALDHGFYYDDEELAVMVTPAKVIGSEWRFVVAAGDVVAGSAYVSDGRLTGASAAPADPAWSFAAAAADRLTPPDPVYVLDVCEADSGLRLLELNPFSGADLYDCDRDAVVAAVHAIAETN